VLGRATGECSLYIREAAVDAIEDSRYVGEAIALPNLLLSPTSVILSQVPSLFNRSP
jgi:hypothetical protein